MCIHDFPATPFPDSVKCNQMSGFSINIVEPTPIEGRCEVCHVKLSTHLFNVGITYHHLCRDCFERMMRTFAEKSDSVLVKKIDCKDKVSVHSIFTPLQA